MTRFAAHVPSGISSRRRRIEDLPGFSISSTTTSTSCRISLSASAGHIRHGLIDLSPPEADDPMLRVVMRLIQHIVADADARDEIAIHEWIFEETKRQGLEEEEVEIAICNLISSGGLIEIGEGEYILGEE